MGPEVETGPEPSAVAVVVVPVVLEDEDPESGGVSSTAGPHPSPHANPNAAACLSLCSTLRPSMLTAWRPEVFVSNGTTGC